MKKPVKPQRKEYWAGSDNEKSTRYTNLSAEKRAEVIVNQFPEFKLLNMHDVSQQSELLKAYDEFAETEHCWYLGTEDHTKEDFLKAFNCG